LDGFQFTRMLPWLSTRSLGGWGGSSTVVWPATEVCAPWLLTVAVMVMVCENTLSMVSSAQAWPELAEMAQPPVPV